MLSQPNIPRGPKVRIDKALVLAAAQVIGCVTLIIKKSPLIPQWRLIEI